MKLETINKWTHKNIISKVLYYDNLTLGKVESIFFTGNILDRVVKEDLSEKVILVAKWWRMKESQPCENPEDGVPERGNSENPEVGKELGLCEEQAKTSVVWIRCL